MNGKTLEQKRENFKKTIDNKELAEALSKKQPVNRAGISGATRIEKMTAGIEKLQPVQQEMLDKLIENNFSLRGKEMTAGTRDLINALRIANIIETKKWGRNISEITIKDTKRLIETQKTNYIQWPELPSLYKKRN